MSAPLKETVGRPATGDPVYVSGLLFIEQPEEGSDLASCQGRVLLCTRGVLISSQLLDKMPRCVVIATACAALTKCSDPGWLRRWLSFLSGVLDTKLLQASFTARGMQAPPQRLAAVKRVVTQRAVQALHELAGERQQAHPEVSQPSQHGR